MKNNRNSNRSLKNKASGVLQNLFYISAFILLFSACSSDDNGGSDKQSDYYFRASLDGKKIDFRTAKFQGGGNDNRFEMIVLGGFDGPHPTKAGEQLPPSLDFEIWKVGGNITPGTYSTPGELEMIARYAIQTPDGTILYNTAIGDDVFTAKIESISKTGIKGTFEGMVRNVSSGKTISITEGSFNLPYDQIVNP
ncbi:hypothetical protein FLA105534_02908 [Flavobacterium bizetiae]|uniref:Uncharacterized protein n=1 Tax=Flavobacterium bizetiae TaxID=2704140 RepID=A0A6J4GP47_9FLAO|nr:hypothetical protein [Flavobacterium bizetiae]CAA9200012.1 hypothetical protein FLA105534_02908 [Flavobacterium bizetiae]CAD5343100.1 hypothetical protein FLA105535_03098 [Flavobacterium bizetiae]CAD5346371.1 hypothetical protein FLA105534_00312 [Flavobacterium bizetiae]